MLKVNPSRDLLTLSTFLSPFASPTSSSTASMLFLHYCLSNHENNHSCYDLGLPNIGYKLGANHRRFTRSQPLALAIIRPHQILPFLTATTLILHYTHSQPSFKLLSRPLTCPYQHPVRPFRPQPASPTSPWRLGINVFPRPYTFLLAFILSRQ